jgi:hypothetical protein
MALVFPNDEKGLYHHRFSVEAFLRLTIILLRALSARI